VSAADNPLAAAIATAVSAVPVDYGGGSSIFKGTLMASFIVGEELRTAVEIGVHRGRSFVALGLAERAIGGHAWGVDPYTDTAYPDPTLGGVAPEGFDDWLDRREFDAARDDALRAIAANGLEASCTMLRQTSADAASRFAPASIDLLHVDGNHSEASVRDDLQHYLPLLRPGAILVLDDISWRSVRRAAEPLLEEAEIVFELVDTANRAGLDLPNDFRVYRLPA
jgi:methyltransferase family protein